METYGFVHFGPNTFSGAEWGDGREKPEVFNPTQLDCNQWVSAFKAAGMKGVIITAKHHDGFCLWPSKYSTHTVAQSPLKRDILKELSEACKKNGLKLGVYLSPWDRNHPNYGTEAYNDTFVYMLNEVLTQYGPIFEVWFDGANGEGPNGKRQVYDWKRYIDTVRKLQPNAVIFSDAGPDVRWVGNEQGIAPETCYATINRDRYTPGTSLYKELGEGIAGGSHWVPAECDVSIRPGWFWRESENTKVKTALQLEDLYYKSVGRGGSFLLNVPPDTRGLIHENDVKTLSEFGKRVKQTFKEPVSTEAKATLSGDRMIELDLRVQKTFDCIELREEIDKGQAIQKFSVSVKVGGDWVKIASGTTVGAKRLIRINPVRTRFLKVNVEYAQGQARLLQPQVYASPECGTNFMHETKEQKDARMDWWRFSRFGMFIHWGLYSIPGGEWKGKNYGGASEWLISSAGIAVADWTPLQQQFNPKNFDAKKIVDTARLAGMKYIVITSKHHEGFAIYPSKQGTWHIGNGAFKRDPLQELSDECRRQGIKFCTYHSILDWNHPDYLPREKWDKRSATGADFERYIKHMKAQLKEVITRYKPEVMWFDGEWQNTWNHTRGVDLYNYCRSLSPDMIVNNRVDTGRSGMQGFSGGGFAGDFGTPEQEIPANGVDQDWESCMTMNNSWGFHAKDFDWKSAQVLIQNLVDCASKGGNYLLNVGPNSLGEIPNASIDRLLQVGKWVSVNSEAIYGSQASPFPKPMPWGRVTRKGNTLYCTVFDSEASRVKLSGLLTGIKSATVLGSRERVEVIESPEGPSLIVPKPSSLGPVVIKVGLAGKPVIDATLQSQNADGSLDLDASSAEVVGGAHYEADKKCIGFWTNPLDTVSWSFSVSKPGTYDVQLELACDSSSDGSLTSLILGNQELQFVVPASGGWSSFTKLDIGKLNLIESGKQTVTIKARMMPKGAVMNLRSVQLRPSKS
jgi:alpha-L-fucosidase